MNERNPSEMVKLEGAEIKKVEDFKNLGSTVQRNRECGKRGEEACAVTLEQVEKTVRCDV